MLNSTHSLTHLHVDCVCCGETGTSKCECWEAVRATTAAPTYYSPAVIGGQKFVDGAILANNPTLIALVRDSTCFCPDTLANPRPTSPLSPPQSEAAVLWPGRSITAVVSLGTAEPAPSSKAANGVVSWVKKLIELAMSSNMTHKISAGILGNRYHRFDADSGEGAVDLAESRPVRAACLRVVSCLCAAPVSLTHTQPMNRRCSRQC